MEQKAIKVREIVRGKGKDEIVWEGFGSAHEEAFVDFVLASKH